MKQTPLIVALLFACGLSGHMTFSKKMSSTQPIPMIEVNRQDGMNGMNGINGMPLNTLQSSLESNPTIRASSFMVDPLIIIALIALPTIGMLGLSSLIMPLIPIGIYLIQQFFPTSAGRRRRSLEKEWSPVESRINNFASNFERMLHRFNVHY